VRIGNSTLHLVASISGNDLTLASGSGLPWLRPVPRTWAAGTKVTAVSLTGTGTCVSLSGDGSLAVITGKTDALTMGNTGALWTFA
jgi:hypothetical protein